MASRRIVFPLLTERLLIGPMALADAEDLLEVNRDAQTMQHLTTDLRRRSTAPARSCSARWTSTSPTAS